MLDWQQTIKAKSLSVNTHTERVGPQSSKGLDKKVPKNCHFNAPIGGTHLDTFDINIS